MLRTQENLMIQLSRGTVAAMPPQMQRLVGYAATEEGLGFASPPVAERRRMQPTAFPAQLLGEGGADLLREESETARPRAVSNYKRLLAHLDEHMDRASSAAKKGPSEDIGGTTGEMRKELAELKRRAWSTSQRMHELQQLLRGELATGARPRQ
jgi:hypothetical protein